MDIFPDFEASMHRVQLLEEQRRRDPRAIIPLIQLYEWILGQVVPTEQPAFCATICGSLGDVYKDILTGDRTENLKQAIRRYKQTLDLLPPDTDPIMYAVTQSNLGNAYRELPIGNRASNLTEAIQYYQASLRILTPNVDAMIYATIQNNLGMTYREIPTGDRTKNIEQAIQHYKQALHFWTAKQHPLLYATVQNNLGNSYRDRATGNRAENLALAIHCYQEALPILTPESDRLRYAMLLNNLGAAYGELLTNDRAANLTQAIHYLEASLRFRIPEENPVRYAEIQHDLGQAYGELPSEDRNASLKKAIEYHQKALLILTSTVDPIKYALIQIGLGTAYYALAGGDRTNNLEQAIQCFQEALRFYTPKIDPIKYSDIQSCLGSAYYERATGDQPTNWKKAVHCFEQALHFITSETDVEKYTLIQNILRAIEHGQLAQGQTEGTAVPPGFEAEIMRAQQLEKQSQKDLKSIVPLIQTYQQIIAQVQPDKTPHFYSSIHNDLGVAYRRLPTGDRAAHLEQAIQHFHEALRFLTSKTAPLAYAGIHNNLGNVYSELPTGDRIAHLKQAIQHFQEALHFRTAEAAPLAYAETQNSLGIVYSELPTGDQTADLTQSIQHFQEALRFLTPVSASIGYAMIQNNLGLVYSKLPTGDRTANLVQAIRYFQEALRFRTPDTDPMHYAETQNNLGLVYSKLPTGDRAANLAQAIHCYEQSLRFWTADTNPPTYARVQSNLGNVYSALPTGDKTINLKQAIWCYRKALHFLTPKTAPFDYARIQNNLGNVYHQSPTGNLAVDLTQAIQCYKEALLFYTPETNPIGYAGIQNNLGIIYTELPAQDQTTHIEQAIDCYKEALRIYTPESDPFECRKVNRNLAQLYFIQSRWEAALQAYRVVMDIGAYLYHVGLSTESKGAEISESALLYTHAAFAAAHCGENAEALLILEQGKTRLLTEALRLHVRRPAHVPDELWRLFEDAITTVQDKQAEKTSLDAEIRNHVQAYKAHIQTTQAANTKLNEAIKLLQSYDPHFLAAIDLPTIEDQTLDTQTALISFCITEQGSLGFVVSRHNQLEIQVVPVPTFTRSDLHHLFAQWDGDASGKPTDGWLGAYNHYHHNKTLATFTLWQEKIVQVLAELGKRLFAPILATLSADIKQIIFLPSAELFLFPLHAIPLSNNGLTLICDQYQVSYAPSIEVLRNIRARATSEVIPSLYAVINPQADPHLFFTPAEGEAIAEMFTQKHVDKGLIGNRNNVIAGVHEKTYLHFSCHGSYNWDNPTLSGVRLADDFLTLADLQQGTVDLSHARLVTLSACETGISDVIQSSPEEYVGVPAGFLIAGVPCVVCSLWAVEELSTAILMERFYQNHLQKGMDIPTALNKAQLWMRRATAQQMELASRWEQVYQDSQETNLYARRQRDRYRSNPEIQPFAHPYYWAAFTVNGL